MSDDAWAPIPGSMAEAEAVQTDILAVEEATRLAKIREIQAIADPAVKKAAIRENEGKPPAGAPVGQYMLAKIFAEDHADTLRYVHDVGWHEWDGMRFLERRDGADKRAVMATVENAVTQGLAQHDDTLTKAAQACQRSLSGMKSVLEFAGAMEPISTGHAQLDADPNLFNTPMGTMDLLTGEIRPHSQEDLITRLAGASGSTVQDDLSGWHAFIERILPDPSVRSFVQRLIGYSMSGKVTEHVMPIFTGTGANGKGTLRDALMAAFGDYAIEVDPALLMESKHERHGTFKMRLRGSRLVFCSETERGRRFAEATMKRLVGGDPIEANLMHKNPITFDPSHTLIMLTNHLPIVSGDDPAVWRRILVVPFDVVIPEHERDGELSSRLKLAAPEIISWAFEGWKQYKQQGGLNPPEAVKLKTKEYQAASDVVARFLDECTIRTSGTTKARDLYSAWKQWCHVGGESSGTEKAFADSMASRGAEKRRGTGGAVIYVGLTLLAQEGDPEEEDRRYGQ